MAQLDWNIAQRVAYLAIFWPKLVIGTMSLY